MYLYGELDFAAEEAVESHLAGCAFCQLALAREKEWHASLNSGQPPVPFELLADCRAKLQAQIACAPPKLPNELWRERWQRYLASFYQACQTWPARVAVAGLLLVIGFGAGRTVGFRPVSPVDPSFTAAGLGPFTRVKAVQRVNDGQVRIALDQVQQGELTGPITDVHVRHVLLIATRDAADPAIRVDSVDALAGQPGADVQQALLASLQQDSNSAVRMKALEALRPAAASPVVRSALIGVLQRDADPGLRSEAIDVLLSGATRSEEPADILRAMQQTAQPGEQDDYVRARSIQFLRMVTGRVVEAY